ncbi:hypothetical protein E3_0120 [Rhodococcus phage E3]|uniref:hypothetical protein n=1 Tax=Rhodococcus phage E3 TaxID=1007869 RepID=UPI0002C6AE7F|nr:hypothetical protein M176_gp012 [Rhodococcus phage E3]AEQ20922.1 hypothetical protein E3_0120 [Rhodococcus phage E3]
MAHTTNADRIRAAAKANGWTEDLAAKHGIVFSKGDTSLAVSISGDTILDASTLDFADPGSRPFWAVKAHHSDKLDRIREILRTRS